MDRKVLVTGASGFVGQSVTRLIHDARCIVREEDENSLLDYYVVASIDATTDWGEDCFNGVDSIVHLAGLAHSKSYTVEEYKAVNTYGTLNLALKAAQAGVKRIVFVSSIGVNGTSTDHEYFTPDSIVNPHNAYAQSKYEAELGLQKLSEEVGIEFVIVRPTLVYGPDAPGNFGMLTKLVSKLPCLPFGLARNKRDFIAVQNLADLLVTCATHPNAAGHTFLASDSETVSIKEFTNAIAKGLNKKTVQVPIPVFLMKLVGKITGNSTMIEQLYGNLEVDSSNIKEVLGWTPPYTMKQAMASLSEKKS